MEIKLKVCIVEDTEDIRNGIAQMINLAGDLVCEKVFADGETAVKDIPLYKPDVVLMDIDLPGMSGIDCIARLKEYCPQTQFMMLTVYEDDDKIFRSLEAGATGYMLKRTSSPLLIEAIRDLHNGGSPMNAQIARRVVASFSTTKAQADKHELTKREFELLNLLSQGYRYKDIAAKLFISQDTVRTHIRNIYIKLQVKSKIEAINKVFNR